MKAALLDQSLNISIEEVDKPRIKNDEVLVRIRSCGVCATDVKKFTGASSTPNFPFILGHEPAGIIEAVGKPNEKNLKVGERVAVAPVVVCERCFGCTSGLVAREGMGMCENYYVIGYSCDGAFTEYLSVPARNIFRIPNELSFKDAAIIEPVAACANGVFKSLSTPPSKAVVLGAGFMGLTSLALLKTLGAQVLIADILDDRLKIAKQLGADAVVNSRLENLEDEVKHFTNGRGAESVICAVGIKELTETGIRLLSKAGKIVFLASGPKGTKIELDLNETHYFHPVITGAVSYTTSLFQWTIDVLAKGMIDTNLLISHSGGLDQVKTFLEQTRDREGLKKVILMSEE